MNIKDFNVGEKAFVIEDGEIKAVEIEKVGRKYVYIKHRCYTFSLWNEKDNYLTDDSIGHKIYLFLSEQDAHDVFDRDEIIADIRSKVSWGVCKLSIDQLRRIHEIINEVK